MTRVFLTLLLVSNCLALPFAMPSMQELSKLRVGAIELNNGTVWFELYPEDAPFHVANLKWLSDIGFFRNRRLTDFKDGYILQFGKLTPAEVPKFHYLIPPEFSERKHESGSLSMARVPDSRNPSRSSSPTTIHILLRKASAMDGNFTVFGRVTEGLHLFNPNSVIKDLIVYVDGD